MADRAGRMRRREATIGAAMLALMPWRGHAQAVDPAQATSLGPVTRRPLPRFVSLRKRANIRRGPGSQHRIDWQFLHAGMPLRVVAEFDVWRKVVDADGASGWVHHFFLRGERTVIVRIPETALHAGPAVSERIVARAQEGAILALSGCEGGFCAVEADGIEGWIARTAVWGVDTSE